MIRLPNIMDELRKIVEELNDNDPKVKAIRTLALSDIITHERLELIQREMKLNRWLIKGVLGLIAITLLKLVF